MDGQEAYEACITAWETVDRIVPHAHIPDGDWQAFSVARGMVRKASDGKHNGFIGLEGAGQIADMLERKVAEVAAVGEKKKIDLFEPKDAMSKKRVFVVHGSDDGAKSEIAHLLGKVGLEPIILHEQATGGRTIAEKLEKYSDVGFAVVIMTLDDHGGPGLAKAASFIGDKPRARQNVVLELGYFWGALGRDRVCALLKRGVEKPSDYDGVVYVAYEGNWKTELLRELHAAGMEFDATKA
ncbi:MAG: nucleotide-binding protein [Planctomycetes bacterium]|nr:nucleotide-binding protein [Planctomycetota bacterium]